MGLIHEHTPKPLRQHSTPKPRHKPLSKKPKYFAQSVQNEAQAYVQGAVSSAQQSASDQAHQYAHQVRSEAERQMLHVAGEAQQHLDVANQTISSLQVRNQELEAQQQQMQQQIAMLQATMQNMIAQQKLQADTSHTHAANITQAAQGPNQNGADVSEALKALAASVGETMKELREIVSPKGSPKRNRLGRSARRGESSGQGFTAEEVPQVPCINKVNSNSAVLFKRGS